MKNNKKQYSERFVVIDYGDYSVGIQGYQWEADLIMQNGFENEEDRKRFNDAFKEFLLAWFSDTSTEVKTLGEIQDEVEELEKQMRAENNED